ncbi:MAG: DNA polymerase III subunit delta [Planctomycetaceae bacterium]|jgi:DNA polymerase-3 subunit delta|nr:DNA polymerase III subunit delta [Planctomycetaceae bacterium]
MKPVSFLDFILHTKKYPSNSVAVVFGDDSFLKSYAIKVLRDQVLKGEDAEFSLSRFNGNDVTFSDIRKELSTRAMFGGSRRFVWIEDADGFVSKYRGDIEGYLDKMSDSALFMLELKSFPSNTNLFKKMELTGLMIEAKSLTDKEVPSWVMKWSKHRHNIECDPAAAALLFERIGSEAGLLDQELAKLALMTPPNNPIITAELVEQTTGSWRVQSTFDMIDQALAGRTASAIKQLDVLLSAGENEVAILAQIAYSLRKFAAATRVILDAELAGRPVTVQTALDRVGVKRFFMEKSERQLKMLGRNRGSQLIDWLLQTDMNLKGSSRNNPRFILETLIIKIADPRLR